MLWGVEGAFPQGKKACDYDLGKANREDRLMKRRYKQGVSKACPLDANIRQ